MIPVLLLTYLLLGSLVYGQDCLNNCSLECIPFIPAHAENYADGRDPDPNNKVDKIVIHAMSGTQEGTIEWFKDPESKASAHFLVSSKGEIIMMVSLDNVAYHAGGDFSNNQSSIGIELEDGASQAYLDADSGWPTRLQYEATAKLVRCLAALHDDIYLDRKHIIGHSEVPRSKKTDPGLNWDWDYFMQLVINTN